ncbi:uncharacterized protein isoform X3 [Rhodnius prolixus]|uniref:uncharacterized protein isoform X3 n=1 Tax=Rhodnius prolixus TaxID=13249 RepID=UPI003D18E7D6
MPPRIRRGRRSNNTSEAGSFQGLEGVRLYETQNELMQLAGSLEAVRLVANSNSFLRHTHGPNYIQELALEKQQLEPVVCPLHGELVHHQHHNFFTLHPHNPFIWYLRYWYDMKHVDGGAIVVRRTGELVTKNPLQHIGRYGVHALNLWINK